MRYLGLLMELFYESGHIPPRGSQRELSRPTIHVRRKWYIYNIFGRVQAVESEKLYSFRSHLDLTTIITCVLSFFEDLFCLKQALNVKEF